MVFKMTKKVFYEKKGKRYIPIAEYDSDFMDSFPKGATLVQCYPGGSSRTFRVDPNYAAMIAAGRVAEEVISQEIRRASDLRPRSKPITLEQRAAWENLSLAFGEDMHLLEWPSAREVAEKAVEAMMLEADKLMSNPVVKRAFEHFILVCELTKEEKNDRD